MTSSNGAQYVQDGLGQTVAKIGGANAAEIVYFAGLPLAFRDPATGGYTDLVWAGGTLIAEVAGTETATPTWRLTNQVGTLVMTTDNYGAVTGTNRMTPYGRVLSSNATDPFLFAGLLADTNGTDAARVRNYATAPARWLRPDPNRGSYDLANPQSFNRYMYVNGNPLAFGDPSGLDFNFYCGPGCVGVFGEIPTLGPITSTLSALLGFYHMFQAIFGWGGGPQFTGSIKPRPDTQKNNTTNNVSCGSKLPNGQIVGDVVQQQRALLQKAFDRSLNTSEMGTPSDPTLFTLGRFFSIAEPHGPIDFKNKFAGMGNPIRLGKEGNFAYYAIGAGYISKFAMDFGAGAYGLTYAILGRKSFSSLTGPLFSDQSAASVRNAALAANGCQ